MSATDNAVEAQDSRQSTPNEHELRLALVDAANNCERDGATATLTARCGVQWHGTLKRPLPHARTCIVYKPDGGWCTVRIRDLAAVETTPRRPF